ncbi:hypothetical protein AVEN_144322-1 [Araneus ventricosus]|uniref:Uncharacterized protein n=1 Tax=Araneus ventricosus TaxID=182803 RepID=A0A4Y2J7I1_ARAVE|nr:hypothetical protein AVEN_144322-1 [Araneus ventricosus]
MATKRKCSTLSIAEKKKIIDAVDNGGKEKLEIVKDFGGVGEMRSLSEEEEDDDKKCKPPPKRTLKETLSSIQTMRSFIESRSEMTT